MPALQAALLRPASRIAFVVKSMLDARKHLRAIGIPRTTGDAWQLGLACVASGAQPNEAWIWRKNFATASSGPDALHPLPARSGGMLLSELGDPRQHQLLEDKLKAAEVLCDAGVLTPPTIAVLPRGQAFDRTSPLWTTPRRLFVKPRHGFAARGAYRVEVCANGTFNIEGLVVDWFDLERRLQFNDDLIVQPLLAAAPDLADLASAGAPVLRITTARLPGEEPFVHGSSVAVSVPGRSIRNFLYGHIRAAVHPGGSLGVGVCFGEPSRRYHRLPWNDARLADRRLTWFSQAEDAALLAMSLLPDLAIVAWDFIPTAEGPVLLEGNTGCDWLLIELPRALGAPAASLVPVIERWCEADGV